MMIFFIKLAQPHLYVRWAFCDKLVVVAIQKEIQLTVA